MVAFTKYLINMQQDDSRYRYKVLSAHPPAFGKVSYGTVRIIPRPDRRKSNAG
jgi:hypothetical protein